MPEEKKGCQQIVITHKCGGSFTIQPDDFSEKLDNADPRYNPMCLNCFEPISQATMRRLESFCREYQQTSKSLKGSGFTITIIEPETQIMVMQKKQK